MWHREQKKEQKKKPDEPKERDNEARITRLEEESNRKFGEISKSFEAMKSALAELAEENTELKADRQFLIEKMNNIISPARNEIEDTVEEPAPMPHEIIIKGTKEHRGKEKHFLRKKEIVTPAPVEKRPEEKVPYADHQSRRIQTPLDELLDLVMKKGAVKVADAAKAFHVKDSQVEEWAKLLEEHELIEIHYPTIGKPVLKKKVAYR